jgi:hypothetical protein
LPVIPFDRVPVDLEPVALLEFSFDRLIGVFDGMKPAQIDDWPCISAILVEKLREVALERAATQLAFVLLNFECDFFEPVGGD